MRNSALPLCSWAFTCVNLVTLGKFPTPLWVWHLCDIYRPPAQPPEQFSIEISHFLSFTLRRIEDARIMSSIWQNGSEKGLELYFTIKK
jgi:hypothetical protein